MTDKTCKFYISSKKCKFGKHCKFVHSQVFSTENYNSFLEEENHGILSNNRSVAPCETIPVNFHQLNQRSYSENGAVNNISDYPLTHQNQSFRPCTFFVRNGFCNYGQNCRYYHPNGNQNYGFRNEQYRRSGQNEIPLTKSENLEHDYMRENVDGSSAGHDRKDRNPGKQSEKQLCSYFSKYGHCKYGRSCKYLHFYHKKKSTKEEGQIDEARKGTYHETSKKRTGSNFQEEICPRENRCHVVHPRKLMSNTQDEKPGQLTEENKSEGERNIETKEENVKKTETDASFPQPKKAPRLPFIPKVKKVPDRKTISGEELNAMRKTEIEQLKKRFPSDKLTVIEDNETIFSASFCFTPSDPDWPFDVKDFVLKVNIPCLYPKQLLSVVVPEEQDLPEAVRRYVETDISEWLEEKFKRLEKEDKIELVFRPMLRWLERNIEGSVTNGLRQFKKELIAKAAGFEFISPSQLQASIIKENPVTSSEEEENENDSGSDASDESSEEVEDQSHLKDDNKENKEDKSIYVDVEKKGTEVSLKNLQLKEQSGTLVFEHINLSIQCARCKTCTDLTTPVNRVNSIDCSKCNFTQLVRFRPSIAHQMSSVIGYLDLDSCVPFDLVLPECNPVVSCLNCNKSTKITGFFSGQVYDTNCRSCHQKLRVAADAVRFLELQKPGLDTSSSDNVHKVGVKKAIRVAKNPAIQEGKPLPANGACKHYKKSFRWLRFPCCGKAYPCDVCHDEQESDHEMKYANRMICGFCCTEQVYSVEKACKGCAQLLTKTSSHHWEGGQGCRDKIRMNRGDSQKYSNMGKTISRHAQKVKDMNSKKKTKLRHT